MLNSALSVLTHYHSLICVVEEVTMIDGLHLWVRMMTNVINHRQANGQACRGLWSSLPPKGHVLSYLLCHVVMQRGEYTASRASPLHPWKLSIA